MLMFARWRRPVAAMAMLLALAPAGASAFQRCLDSSGDRALSTRLLQTELMVAAIACGNQTLYNSFVERFRSELVREGKSMQDVFQAEYRGNAGSHVNAFVTRLANEASRRSQNDRIGFCQESQLLFTEALATDPRNFQTLVAKVRAVSDHGVRRCDNSVAGYGTAGDLRRPPAKSPQ